MFKKNLTDKHIFFDLTPNQLYLFEMCLWVLYSLWYAKQHICFTNFDYIKHNLGFFNLKHFYLIKKKTKRDYDMFMMCARINILFELSY